MHGEAACLRSTTTNPRNNFRINRSVVYLMEEQRHLTKSKQSHEDSSECSEEEDEDWLGSEEESLEEEGSFYSDSDSSSIPEWESSIDDNTGELLYIDCHPFVTQYNNNSEGNKSKDSSEPFSKDRLRRSTRGKFLQLIRRRESKRYSKRYQKTQDASTLETSTNKVKFQDSQEGEEKEVVVKVNQIDNTVCPKNTPLVELMLGINLSTLSDGNRLMIAGFPQESEAKHDKNIKIGDWLKSINNIYVTNQNLSAVLEKLFTKQEVLLKLQRVAGVEVTKDPPINELNSQSHFVREMIDMGGDENENLLQSIFSRYSIGIVYLDPDKLSDTSPEFYDVIYHYPKQTILSQSRGIYTTLNDLIGDLIPNNKPKTSTILYKENMKSHIVYHGNGRNNKILLLMIPLRCSALNEAVLIAQDVVCLLEFLFDTLDDCFSNANHIEYLDHFFKRFFMKLLSNNEWTTTSCFIEFHNQDNQNLNGISLQFEQVLPGAISLQLPFEAALEVDDALTELEASDYRDWNEEPLDCQRLFTILGSALYHYGYLLASHLTYEDLVNVHTFCRQQGFFHLSKTEPVKTLLYWREVFPQSCRKREQGDKYVVKIPEGKRYLLVVGSGKDLLMAIMEAGGCTEPAEENMGPDAFYVEEAQATLAHIQEMGLPELADRLLSANPGAQVVEKTFEGGIRDRNYAKILKDRVMRDKGIKGSTFRKR